MFTPLIVAIIVAAAVYLLALVSDAFAYELSRAVEAAFDYAEYRLALRSSRRRQSRRRRRAPLATTAPAFRVVSRSHAGNAS